MKDYHFGVIGTFDEFTSRWTFAAQMLNGDDSPFMEMQEVFDFETSQWQDAFMDADVGEVERQNFVLLEDAVWTVHQLLIDYQRKESEARMALTCPPITADMMAADYLTEVRANGEWAIGNVARTTDQWMFEIIHEVLEAAKRARPLAMAYHSNDGDLSDVVWDMATVAAEFAIECCKVEYPNAHHYKENA